MKTIVTTLAGEDQLNGLTSGRISGLISSDSLS